MLRHILKPLLSITLAFLLLHQALSSSIQPSFHLILPSSVPGYPLPPGISPPPEFPNPFGTFGTSRPSNVHSTSSRYWRLIKISWFYVPPLIHEQTISNDGENTHETYYIDFWVDPLTTHVIDAVDVVCSSSEYEKLCGGESGVIGIKNIAQSILNNVFSPYHSLRRVYESLEIYLKKILSSQNTYLKSSDLTSAEFIIYQTLEIRSILSSSTCNSNNNNNNKVYLKHSRPTCTSPVSPHLKSIGACPFAALDDLEFVEVHDSVFVCEGEEGSGQLSVEDYLRAAQLMTSSR